MDGRHVVIKIRYPGVAEAVDADLENLGRLIRMAGKLLVDREGLKALMEEIRGPAGRNIWDKLANVNEAVLPLSTGLTTRYTPSSPVQRLVLDEQAPQSGVPGGEAEAPAAGAGGMTLIGRDPVNAARYLLLTGGDLVGAARQLLLTGGDLVDALPHRVKIVRYCV